MLNKQYYKAENESTMEKTLEISRKAFICGSKTFSKHFLPRIRLSSCRRCKSCSAFLSLRFLRLGQCLEQILQQNGVALWEQEILPLVLLTIQAASDTGLSLCVQTITRLAVHEHVCLAH